VLGHGSFTKWACLCDSGVQGVMVVQPTKTFRRFLRTIASTGVSGIGSWDRLGQHGVDMRLDCRGDDGQPLISINQLDGGNVEVFVSNALEPEQYVTAFEGLRGVHLDTEVLGDGIDEFFSSDLRPPLEAISERIRRFARSFDGIDVAVEKITDGFCTVRFIDEDGQKYAAHLIANDQGHYCYYRADMFDLAVAIVAAECYRAGFHLVMLSSCTGMHQVKAFNKSRQDVELLGFDVAG